MGRAKIATLYPASTIGIIGGGQLGRMIAFKAKQMGYNLVILDPTLNSPAGQITDKQIIADYNDLEALRELAQLSDVITYEFEHINADLLALLEREGHKIYPSAKTLRIIQNKYDQKKLLREIGINTPNFYYLDDLGKSIEFLKGLGGKAVLKTCQNGYDGKGNVVVNNTQELKAAFQQFAGSPLMMEEYINFKKELSILVARNQDGYEFYPVSENIHKDSILIQSLVPASIPENVQEHIIETSHKIVDAFDDYGLFCIEYFLDDQSNILVNEIAPRPHNSGHYSIEGCICSQFEQLVRIICGMPLGSSKLRAPCVMQNILGEKNLDGNYCVLGVEAVLKQTDCHLHLYGKADTKHLKKIGHITAIDNTLESAQRKVQVALGSLRLEESSSFPTKKVNE